MRSIFLCAPSMPFDTGRFDVDKIKSNFEKNDFEVTFSKHAFENAGNTSSSIENRIEDLYEGFSNPEYDVIMSLVGGFNSNELLPHLDFDYLKRFQNKKFIGMSDMTTLCVNLYQKSGIQTFYGTQGRHFVNDLDFSQMISVLDDHDEFAGFYRSPIRKDQILKDGEMTGTLYGGNLALLCWLLGTEYELKLPENSILFLEDDEETNGYYLQMYLNHLKQAGYFEKINGLVFGKVLEETKFVEKSNFEDILNLVFKDHDFPIYIDADFGHIENPITIPYGQNYTTIQ